MRLGGYKVGSDRAAFRILPQASQRLSDRGWKVTAVVFMILSLLLAAELLYHANARLGIRYVDFRQGQTSRNRPGPRSLHVQGSKCLSSHIESLDNQARGDGPASQSASYMGSQAQYAVWLSLNVGTALENYYDYVRSNTYSSGLGLVDEGEWREFPNYYDLSVTFAAELASHDIGNCWWPALEAASGYYNRTGEYSYQTSSRIMDLAMIASGICPSDSALAKVEKVLSFTNTFVHYEDRILDHMWFPCETLTFRSGDCTGFSILAAALLERAGIKAAIAFFANSTIGHHAMVLVNLDNLGPFGYWYYEDLTAYGLDSGKWVIIEPQCPSLSVQQSTLDWIGYWDLAACAEVPGGP